MKLTILCTAAAVALLIFAPMGASATVDSAALNAQSFQVNATPANDATELMRLMSFFQDETPDSAVGSFYDFDMANCVACDASKSKGACKGKTSCSADASTCRKRGCRVKGTTSKCKNSC